MAQYELESLLSASIDGLKGMVDTNTVIGKPVETSDGTTIIPVTRVSVGYGMGGWNYEGKKNSDLEFKNDGITAGSGGGVTINPIGFLVVSGGNVKFVNASVFTPFEKLCEFIPD
ncbi:MAG: sporulation protein YtfJ, partial [Clostridia bacterium]|nr:sporulation protein YtfJ [Clostridia bacterium]